MKTKKNFVTKQDVLPSELREKTKLKYQWDLGPTLLRMETKLSTEEQQKLTSRNSPPEKTNSPVISLSVPVPIFTPQLLTK